jgi:hypothetical protein
MRKLFVLGALSLSLAACQTTTTEQRVPLPTPLPEKVSAVPYSELVGRARDLSMYATEALYTEKFDKVEEAARGLERTAEYIVAANDVPAKHKDTRNTTAADLGKLAKLLRESAATKDADKANETLGKINAKVRSMRVGD